jgi:hypothetical protein
MMDSVFFFLKKQLLSDPAPPSPGETMKATFRGEKNAAAAAAKTTTTT